MGVDFFDIQFQLEKRFDFKIFPADFQELFPQVMKRVPPGWTAGDVYALVCRKIEASGRPIPYSCWNGVRLVLARPLGVKLLSIRRESLLKDDLGAE